MAALNKINDMWPMTTMPTNASFVGIVGIGHMSLILLNAAIVMDKWAIAAKPVSKLYRQVA